MSAVLLLRILPSTVSNHPSDFVVYRGPQQFRLYLAVSTNVIDDTSSIKIVRAIRAHPALPFSIRLFFQRTRHGLYPLPPVGSIPCAILKCDSPEQSSSNSKSSRQIEVERDSVVLYFPITHSLSLTDLRLPANAYIGRGEVGHPTAGMCAVSFSYVHCSPYFESIPTTTPSLTHDHLSFSAIIFDSRVPMCACVQCQFSSPLFCYHFASRPAGSAQPREVL